MIEPEISESNRSWRAKSWLMITEGRKLKVSSRFIQLVLWIIGFVVLILQGSTLYKPSMRRRAEIIFVPPDLKPPPATTYVPHIIDREKDFLEEKEKAKEIAHARRRSVPEIEKIMPVNLHSYQVVPAGSEVKVTLTSGGANGLVKAELVESVRAEGDVILPAKTILLGAGSSSDDRLFIDFSKAILPDKTTIRVKALAYDQNDRIIGIKGKKISDYAFKLAASSGLIFLGAVADGMRDEVNLGFGQTSRPTLRNAALSGVATATSEIGKDTLEKIKSSESRVEVAHSTSALVIFDDVPNKN